MADDMQLFVNMMDHVFCTKSDWHCSLDYLKMREIAQMLKTAISAKNG